MTHESVCAKCGQYKHVFGCSDDGCSNPGHLDPRPRDKTPVEYPKPWRWTNGLLKDASARVLINASPATDARVFAVTEAAPEMEALLRAPRGDLCTDPGAPQCSNRTPCWDHRRVALLAQIKERAKGAEKPDKAG